ncbi:MAG: hypothetical protein IV105_13255 [Rhizobacter sp.]|nr:hypothetical protein [Rhizobacter sp.]
MLFDPDRHEAHCDTPWDDTRAHAAIRAIAHDIEQHRLDGHWRAHPLDDEGDEPADGCKSLYLGSAGVLWALWYLQRQGAVELASDPAGLIEQAHADYLRAPDTGEVVPSYFLGEAGILLLWWRLTGSAEAADRLYTTIESNIANPTNEALWAAPGTMVAAWQLWEATHDARWRELFLRNVDQLWRTWLFDDKAQCHLWTQDMYGRMTHFPLHQSAEIDRLLIAAGHAVWQAGPLTKGYGVCHGTAGNGHAFLTLYQRTGDPLWLQRARAFAMHSIAQQERMRREHGQGRYTLWTGDPGLAVCLWQCLQGTSGLPALDTLQ